ncbi:ERP2-like protein [Fusarium pseudocircinatum]|uniref:ERP2-like protein n=12 Tax=Fusarium fujikuroi species complex TaxID=171627 RepID=A0A8H5PB11_9HYPO|nr:ERP2-like protein [Fusarium pseudocircinatum]
MAEHNIVVFTGDHCGPEVIKAVEDNSPTAGKFNLNHLLLGGCSIDKTGSPLTDKALAAAKASNTILLSTISGRLADELLGDILSDEASAITGSIGLFPSASLCVVAEVGSKVLSIYEPIHVLQYSLNLPHEAKVIEDAVSATIDTGLRTKDMGGSTGTAEAGDTIVAEAERLQGGNRGGGMEDIKKKVALRKPRDNIIYKAATMRLSTLVAGLFAGLVTNVAATALTYKLDANEKACFHTTTKKQGEKIAFYFAVQSGGSFDVDYVVEGPNGKIIMDGQKERQGDFVFSANVVGDYSFCFDNEMSTFAEKFVDFEIAVENESRAQLPSKQGTTPEQTSILEDSIFKVSGQLSTISRNQKYFRTRENRNFATVNSTEGRIINFSMIQIGLIICMGALQVFVVRFFFQGARKGYV